MKLIKSVIPALLAIILVLSVIGPVFADLPTVSAEIEPNSNLNVGDTVLIYVNVENTYVLDVYPVNVYVPIPDGLKYVSFVVPDKTLQNYDPATGIWGPFRMRHDERGHSKGLIITCKVLPGAAGKEIIANARFSQVAIELNGMDITPQLRPSEDVTGVVTYIPPIASFTATPTTGEAPLNVHFTDTSTKGPTSWNWDFGDGTTSTIQNPKHNYTTPGTYTVSLTARNSEGGNTKTKKDYITVTGDPGPLGPPGPNIGPYTGPSNGNGSNIIGTLKNLTALGDSLSNLQKGGGGGKAYELINATNTPTSQDISYGILVILALIAIIVYGYYKEMKN